MRRMKQILMAAIFASALAGIDYTDTLQAAETPLTDAIKQLQAAPNYSWTTTVDVPGAPFKVSPISGRVDTNGFAILVADASEKVVLAKGVARVLKSRWGWKRMTVGGTKDATENDLFSAKTPTDELADLATKLSDVKADGDHSFSGLLDTASAKAYLLSSMKGRTPGGMTPEMTTVSGKFQLWLADGLPQKYTLTIEAIVSLPFGKKDVACTGTTQIKAVGTTTVEVPTEAKTLLEK